MAKKPASLTGELLARKGEARPSDLKPVNDEGPQGADISILPGRQPHLEGIGVKGQFSTTLPEEKPKEAGDSEEMASEDETVRPSPPEPEIIYTPEESDNGGRTRLIAGAFVGVALVGGVLLALMFNGNDRGVAPVLPQETESAPATAAETPDVTAEAPAQPGADAPAETDVAPLRSAEPAETIETATPAAGETSDPALAAATPDTPAAQEQPAKTATQTPDLEPAAPKAAETSTQAAAPATKTEAPAKAAQAAPAVATGGKWVVQLLASRSEADAKAAWKTLSAKHASILGGHGLDIQKADLGEKGTFFRVRAAGFDSKTAATKACNALKGAGQDCLVRQR